MSKVKDGPLSHKEIMVVLSGLMTGMLLAALDQTIVSTALKNIVEDQLVRADLIVVSGERNDDSFDLITGALNQLGEVKVVDLDLQNSGHFNFGTIGPDKTPIVTLPGDPIGNYLSAEIFIRPMILKC